MSNSAILQINSRGKTGSLGPSGAAGPIGRTGATGSTGATGFVGVYYVSSTSTSNVINITLSDGTTFAVNGNFRGATLADKTAGLVEGSNTAGNPLTQFGLLFDVSGGTFNFKGLCAYGSLRASLTGPNNEYISIDTIYWGTDLLGNFDASTMATGRLLYLGTPTVVRGSGITHSALTSDNLRLGYCGAFNFTRTTHSVSSDDTSSHLNAGAKTISVGPIRKGALSGLTGNETISGVGSTQGIFLDADTAGAFILHTPIGIRGISGSFRANEIASITLLVESDDVWRFPENVYFEPDENYLSCGKNIIGLTTYDAGQTWLATVAHRGHGVENVNRQCIPGYLFGSCCYQNSDGTLECLDYTTQSVCDKLFGNFNPAKSCEDSCGADIGICCANGKCIENVSVTLCDKFGGQYWPSVSCSDYNPDGSNYPPGVLTGEELSAQGRFCYDTCSDVQTVCCKDGQCLGNYTRVQCELILGGKSLTAASCSEADCCDYSTIDGACCLCTNTNGVTGYECLGVLSPSACKAAGGYFMGPGKQCNEVSCGCVCNGGGGNGGGGGGSSEVGICCKDGTCLTSANNKTACDAACGNWLSTISTDEGTYQFGSDPNDCEFCALSRPLFNMSDIGSCNPAIEFIRERMDNASTCCNTPPEDIANASQICTDVFFNLFGVPISISLYSGSAQTLRAKIKDIMTCPLSTLNQLVIETTTDFIIQEWINSGLTVAGNCPLKCCTCDSFGSPPQCNVVYGSIGSLITVRALCNQEILCPGENVALPPGEKCGGPGQIGGGGGGGGSESLNCLELYCSPPAVSYCECSNFGVADNTVKNVKMYLNSTDYVCVPVVCEDCSGYELCEES